MLNSISLLDEPEYAPFFLLVANLCVDLFERTLELPYLDLGIELLRRARTRNERSSYGRHGTCMRMSPILPHHKHRWSPLRCLQNSKRNLKSLTRILLDLWPYQDKGDSSAFDSKSHRVVCTWRRFNADSTCKFAAIERNVHRFYIWSYAFEFMDWQNFNGMSSLKLNY